MKDMLKVVSYYRDLYGNVEVSIVFCKDGGVTVDVGGIDSSIVDEFASVESFEEYVNKIKLTNK